MLLGEEQGFICLPEEMDLGCLEVHRGLWAVLLCGEGLWCQADFLRFPSLCYLNSSEPLGDVGCVINLGFSRDMELTLQSRSFAARVGRLVGDFCQHQVKNLPEHNCVRSLCSGMGPGYSSNSAAHFSLIQLGDNWAAC